MRAYIETLGCSKNQVDSEIMLAILEKNDFKLTNNMNVAEIVIVNTCGFIESAKQESINSILELSDLKKQGNCKVIIVTGCLVQRYVDELSQELPEVDAFLGTTNFNEVANVVKEILNERKQISIIGNINDEVNYDIPRVLTTPSHSAYIKIAEGCDNFCTYCIIPKLRGRFKSRPMEDIIKEAKHLAFNGVKELIIIAQDTTKYGKDVYGNYKLVELLRNLSKVEGINWIRLQYSYPDIISNDLIELIANNKTICNYLDVPIQHCNNNILKKMNRSTSKEEILNLITKLRSAVPDIAIRTSLIVGFPGETEEQFNELYDFVKNVRFDRLGVFTYSIEEGTPAAEFKDQISHETKELRRNKIMELQQKISLEKNMDKIGNIYDILIEEKMKNDDNIYIGRSEFDAPEVDGIIYVRSNKDLILGDFQRVKITDALEYDLIGEVVNEFSK